MTSFIRDLRFAARALRRTPGFLAVTILTLALGVGATTAIFSVVHGVLLRALPYPDADRVMQVWQVHADGTRLQFSDANFADVHDRSRAFAALAEVADGGVVSVSGTSEPVRARGALVSREFFTALGVRPILGRTFVPEEQRQGGAPAVVVSYGFWQRYLGANPRAVTGATLTFEGRPFSIVGVMPATLDYPLGAELWVPRELEAPFPARTAHNWQVVGRLATGTSLEQARRDVSAIARALKQQYGDATWMSDVALVPLRDQIVGRVKPALGVLLAASGFLLLIACANVVNLLVARMTARQGEVAVRLALGANRWVLARQFLAESMLLAAGGCTLGVLLAALGVRTLRALQPGNLPRAGEVDLSVPVLLFALGVSIVAAVALGLLTAWRATRSDVRDALAQSQRTQAGAGASYRLRGSLVVAQMALTLVLLVGAGLLGRSFIRLMQVDPGYRTERTLVLDTSLPPADDTAGMRQTVRFYDDLMARVRALPGVTQVGAVDEFPLATEGTSNGTFLIVSRPDEPLRMEDLSKLMRDPSRTGEAEFRVASQGYFRAMSIPLIRGRLFEDRDAADAPHVAVISASLAKSRWPNEEPIGKVIQFGNMDGDLHPFTIIGIVGDVREASLASPPRPTFYASYRQRPRKAASLNVAIAVSGDVAPVITAARRIVRDLRPDVPPRFRTIETVVSQSVADRRFVLLLVGVFGAAALLLATLGVYGVISFLVTQRRKEIGIRVALGARQSDVLSLVLRQGAVLALIGIVAGAATALAVTRLLSRLLYGVSAADPVAFGGVVLLLGGVALLASYIPARRAAGVEPMQILRGE